MRFSLKAVITLLLAGQASAKAVYAHYMVRQLLKKNLLLEVLLTQ